MKDQSSASVGKGFEIPDPADLPSLKGSVSDAEWELRVELAATYRLCALYGWTDLVFTHISAKLPDEDGQERFLINPYGIMFDEMTASCLVKIDLDGNICQETPYFINPAGFTIHSAIHAAREDAGCVIHVHTPYGVAVSVQNEGLRRYTQFSMVVNNDLAYHDYEGIALDLSERERIVQDLGDKHLLMLRNHGTLTVGANCALAFLRMYFLESACKTQIFAQSAGTQNLHEEPQAMADTVQAQTIDSFKPGSADNLVWPGLMRKLRRSNPGFDA
ncbi:Class II aldolase/adducin domain protein [Sulfitobacter noctilucicola]|uniref:Ribulose-5-phosphate 4-epimerase/fuculose-1-phosphate aldolase n=1 Tax=Sulfitobacter noctilucicola TaxID=1342301 RepID=A0A7W6Q537_9RHOB|nr:class II aldolase/adducin family protein [Sulfitobacter noctilucicola]KIN62060.1 Class II aldolase/adducin domain protein [Sulfitobacter noctilucicola]MBB4173422.1 ribulose-5-phosphate 4-epimerase/fuculose-1-phosphate aldolase [Sulfitobacter noctilucicola]